MGNVLWDEGVLIEWWAKTYLRPFFYFLHDTIIRLLFCVCGVYDGVNDVNVR